MIYCVKKKTLFNISSSNHIQGFTVTLANSWNQTFEWEFHIFIFSVGTNWKVFDSIDHSGSVMVCLLKYWREKVISAQKTLLKKPLQEKEIDHSMEKMIVTVLI